MDAYLARFQHDLDERYEPEIDLELPGFLPARLAGLLNL